MKHQADGTQCGRCRAGLHTWGFAEKHPRQPLRSSCHGDGGGRFMHGMERFDPTLITIREAGHLTRQKYIGLVGFQKSLISKEGSNRNPQLRVMTVVQKTQNGKPLAYYIFRIKNGSNSDSFGFYWIPLIVKCVNGCGSSMQQLKSIVFYVLLFYFILFNICIGNKRF